VKSEVQQFGVHQWRREELVDPPLCRYPSMDRPKSISACLRPRRCSSSRAVTAEEAAMQTKTI